MLRRSCRLNLFPRACEVGVQSAFLWRSCPNSAPSCCCLITSATSDSCLTVFSLVVDLVRTVERIAMCSRGISTRWRDRNSRKPWDWWQILTCRALLQGEIIQLPKRLERRAERNPSWGIPVLACYRRDLLPNFKPLRAQPLHTTGLWPCDRQQHWGPGLRSGWWDRSSAEAAQLAQCTGPG